VLAQITFRPLIAGVAQHLPPVAKRHLSPPSSGSMQTISPREFA